MVCQCSTCAHGTMHARAETRTDGNAVFLQGAKSALDFRFDRFTQGVVHKLTKSRRPAQPETDIKKMVDTIPDMKYGRLLIRCCLFFPLFLGSFFHSVLFSFCHVSFCSSFLLSASPSVLLSSFPKYIPPAFHLYALLFCSNLAIALSLASP